MNQFDKLLQPNQKALKDWYNWSMDVEDVFVEMEVKNLLVTQNSEWWFKQLQDCLSGHQDTANWLSSFLQINQKAIEENALDFRETTSTFHTRFSKVKKHGGKVTKGSFTIFGGGEAEPGDTLEEDQ